MTVRDLLKHALAWAVLAALAWGLVRALDATLGGR